MASHYTNAGKHYSPVQLLSASGPSQSGAGACPWSDWCRGPSDWGGMLSGTGGHGTATNTERERERESRNTSQTCTTQITDLTALSTWAGFPDLHPSLILNKRASSMEILSSFQPTLICLGNQPWVFNCCEHNDIEESHSKIRHPLLVERIHFLTKWCWRRSKARHVTSFDFHFKLHFDCCSIRKIPGCNYLSQLKQSVL